MSVPNNQNSRAVQSLHGKRLFYKSSGKHVREMYTSHTPLLHSKEVQVGNDQEKAQSERESLSKNRGG